MLLHPGWHLGPPPLLDVERCPPVTPLLPASGTIRIFAASGEGFRAAQDRVLELAGENIKVGAAQRPAAWPPAKPPAQCGHASLGASHTPTLPAFSHRRVRCTAPP